MFDKLIGRHLKKRFPTFWGSSIVDKTGSDPSFVDATNKTGTPAPGTLNSHNHDLTEYAMATLNQHNKDDVQTNVHIAGPGSASSHTAHSPKPRIPIGKDTYFEPTASGHTTHAKQSEGQREKADDTEEQQGDNDDVDDDDNDDVDDDDNDSVDLDFHKYLRSNSAVFRPAASRANSATGTGGGGQHLSAPVGPGARTKSRQDSKMSLRDILKESRIPESEDGPELTQTKSRTKLQGTAGLGLGLE